MSGRALARHPGHQVHPAVVGAGGRHRDLRLHDPGTQPRRYRPRIDVFNGLHSHVRPRRSAGLLGVVVGVVAAQMNSSAWCAAASRPSRSMMLQECVDRTAGADVADDRLQVGPRASHGVAGAVLREDRARGQPQCAAGSRRRPADVGRLLDDQHADSPRSWAASAAAMPVPDPPPAGRRWCRATGRPAGMVVGEQSVTADDVRADAPHCRSVLSAGRFAPEAVCGC